jgi:predicted AAA+ superfamily ATPase
MRESIPLRSPDTLLRKIKSQITDDHDYYLLLDEVQLLHGFEEVLNEFLYMRNVDIYVTGSNSKFLSKDVITEFRGRGDEIHVYPLAFAEYLPASGKDVYHAWADYVLYGGLPLTLSFAKEEQKVTYLTNLFTETYLKDIIARNHIEKTQELEDTIDIIASSIGSLTNPSKILATFKSKLNSSVSPNTIKKYIDCLEDAFLINEAKRFDVKGRKYIGSPVKYYFEDVGLRNARLDFRQSEENHIMENIIYNELRYRGFSVNVGMVSERKREANGRQVQRNLEVDFVANLGSKRYYLQSAYRMPDDDKIRQEKNPLVGLNDSFKKIIIVRDVTNVTRDEQGITTMGIFDFLLKENSLEL